MSGRALPSRRRLRSAFVGGVVALTVAFVVANVRPWLWFVDTTPTGGDLGAHVWAPAYLRDALIPQLRLTGWTHDWYAGYPAFAFYMVIPSLLVVVVDVGLAVPRAVFASLAVAAALCGVALAAARRAGRPPAQCWIVAVAVGAVAGALKLLLDDPEADRALAGLLLPAAAAGWVWHGMRSRPRWRPAAAVAAVALVVLVVPMPYGVALKLVAIAGVVALPVAVWAMTRLGGVAAEGRALAAVATLLFLFDRSFNIYGGNLMSTMAGEFAYSLGLASAVVYIGVAARGMQTGRHRVLAGLLLALTGLAHLFSAFFALAATAALLLVLPWRAGPWRRRLVWTVWSGALAAALSAWWVLPFWWNRSLLNDMGWGKERRYLSSLWSRSSFDYSFLANDPPLQIFIVLAAAGAVLVFVRRSRLAMAVAATAAIFAVGFVILPEGRLWNVRILPFYYLAVYLTAALGAGEAIRMGRAAIERRQAARAGTAGAGGGELSGTAGTGGAGGGELSGTAGTAGAGGAAGAGELSGTAGAGDTAGGVRELSGALAAGGAVALAAVAVVVMVGLPLRSLPGGAVHDDGVYRWGPFSSSDPNLGSYWVEYNFEGYERKGPTADGGGATEYWDLVETMGRIGASNGCGPALWEYEAGRLGSYGTPMAPMLLPYWTDRCIGSMEGLYFEASATTPYHFLMQSELSAAPSRAQRDLPYSGLDVARGVDHLRLMGVRYYMAFSLDAVKQARATEDLTEIGSTPAGPWVVFEVAGSTPVEGLSRLPAVVEGLDSGDEWLEASVGAFLSAGPAGPILAAGGPDEWPRMTLPDVRGPSGDGDLDREQVMRRLSSVLPQAAPVEPVEPARVSGIVRRNHSISFSVDRVGAPVLVRTSYFPNWSVSGADGPWRVTPNFMVVVPTETEVRLTYGRSPVEWVALVLTLVGLAAAGWLLMRPGRPAPADAAGTGPASEPSESSESSGSGPSESSGSGPASESSGSGPASELSGPSGLAPEPA